MCCCPGGTFPAWAPACRARASTSPPRRALEPRLPEHQTTNKEADMPVKVYAGTDVTVNDEGFFDDPRQWREDMAPQIAQEAGIGTLTPQHWQVVNFMRHEYAD